MKRITVLSLILLALSAACGSEAFAQDNNPQARVRLEEKVDTLAAHTAVLADTIASRGVRFGREMAERTAVALDSAAVIGERLGRRSLVVGDSLLQRSKRAWKVLRGEDAGTGNGQTADNQQDK